MIAPKEREAQPPTPVGLGKLLLAEGDTPTHFFEALAKHLGLQAEIEIRNYGGIRQLGTFLRTLASTAGFREKIRSLGIARDAENDAKGAYDAALAAVGNANLSAKVKVSYFILPDNVANGMLETLLLMSVADQGIFQCVRDFFVCTANSGFNLPAGPVEAKHQIQVYLAARSEAQMMPGIASYKGAWPFDHTTFTEIKAFLKGL